MSSLVAGPREAREIPDDPAAEGDDDIRARKARRAERFKQLPEGRKVFAPLPRRKDEFGNNKARARE